MPSGYRKAQERLLKLYKAKRLKRFRVSVDEPFIYYAERKQAQYEHRVMVNWAYVWLAKKKWHRVERFDYHQNYGLLECDAFAMLRNTVTGAHRFYFIEAERESHLKFDKVEKYVNLYEQEKYLDWWWVKYAEGFPSILIICRDLARKQEVEAAIKAGNTCGLDFRVYHLNHIITGSGGHSGRDIQGRRGGCGHSTAFDNRFPGEDSTVHGKRL